MTQKDSKSANPYLNARREWDERYGDLLSKTATWQKVAISSMVVAALSVGGIAYIGSQSKIQPFVVQMDKLGAPIAIARPVAAGQEINDRIMISQVGSWIWNARSVLSDMEGQRVLIDRVYAMVSADSGAFLNEYYKENTPFSTDGHTVKVNINNVLKVSDSTYEVTWTESKVMPGRAAVNSQWKASLQIGVDPKISEKPAVAIYNPLGVFVKNFTWQKSFN